MRITDLTYYFYKFCYLQFLQRYKDKDHVKENKQRVFKNFPTSYMEDKHGKKKKKDLRYLLTYNLLNKLKSISK